MLELAESSRWRAPETTAALAEQAVQLARSSGDHATAMRAEGWLAHGLVAIGRGVAAVPRAVQALAEAERAGPADAVDRLRVELSLVAASLSDADLSRTLLNPVLDRADLPEVLRADAHLAAAQRPGVSENDPIDAAVHALRRIGGEYSELGLAAVDIVLARQLRTRRRCEEAARRAKEGLRRVLGEGPGGALDPVSPHLAALLSLELTLAMLDGGHPETVRDAAQAVMSWGARPGSVVAVAWLRLSLARRVYLPAGDLDSAAVASEWVAEVIEPYDQPEVEVECHMLLAEIRERRGNLADALAATRRAHSAERRHAARVEQALVLLTRAASGGAPDAPGRPPPGIDTREPGRARGPVGSAAPNRWISSGTHGVPPAPQRPERPGDIGPVKNGPSGAWPRPTGAPALGERPSAGAAGRFDSSPAGPPLRGAEPPRRPDPLFGPPPRSASGSRGGPGEPSVDAVLRLTPGELAAELVNLSTPSGQPPHLVLIDLTRPGGRWDPAVAGALLTHITEQARGRLPWGGRVYRLGDDAVAVGLPESDPGAVAGWVRSVSDDLDRRWAELSLGMPGITFHVGVRRLGGGLSVEEHLRDLGQSALAGHRPAPFTPPAGPARTGGTGGERSGRDRPRNEPAPRRAGPPAGGVNRERAQNPWAWSPAPPETGSRENRQPVGPAVNPSGAGLARPDWSEPGPARRTPGAGPATPLGHPGAFDRAKAPEPDGSARDHQLTDRERDLAERERKLREKERELAARELAQKEAALPSAEPESRLPPDRNAARTSLNDRTTASPSQPWVPKQTGFRGAQDAGYAAARNTGPRNTERTELLAARDAQPPARDPGHRAHQEAEPRASRHSEPRVTRDPEPRLPRHAEPGGQRDDESRLSPVGGLRGRRDDVPRVSRHAEPGGQRDDESRLSREGGLRGERDDDSRPTRGAGSWASLDAGRTASGAAGSASVEPEVEDRPGRRRKPEIDRDEMADDPLFGRRPPASSGDDEDLLGDRDGRRPWSDADEPGLPPWSAAASDARVSDARGVEPIGEGGRRRRPDDEEPSAGGRRRKPDEDESAPLLRGLLSGEGGRRRRPDDDEFGSGAGGGRPVNGSAVGGRRRSPETDEAGGSASDEPGVGGRRRKPDEDESAPLLRGLLSGEGGRRGRPDGEEAGAVGAWSLNGAESGRRRRPEADDVDHADENRAPAEFRSGDALTGSGRRRKETEEDRPEDVRPEGGRRRREAEEEGPGDVRPGGGRRRREDADERHAGAVEDGSVNGRRHRDRRDGDDNSFGTSASGQWRRVDDGHSAGGRWRREGTDDRDSGASVNGVAGGRRRRRDADEHILDAARFIHEEHIRRGRPEGAEPNGAEAPNGSPVNGRPRNGATTHGRHTNGVSAFPWSSAPTGPEGGVEATAQVGDSGDTDSDSDVGDGDGPRPRPFPDRVLESTTAQVPAEGVQAQPEATAEDSALDRTVGVDPAPPGQPADHADRVGRADGADETDRSADQEEPSGDPSSASTQPTHQVPEQSSRPVSELSFAELLAGALAAYREA
ncbi:hypothetical protein BKA01_006045 [Pseudonocardia eucalypti]|uniref:hypothetical protein n=1 Tax=Pseudonocardia eucalypti TaxID=648755 RepID=UPI00161844DC|nr:hypothetical protein [Pseudonocardia eucalypti]